MEEVERELEKEKHELAALREALRRKERRIQELLQKRQRLRDEEDKKTLARQQPAPASSSSSSSSCDEGAGGSVDGPTSPSLSSILPAECLVDIFAFLPGPDLAQASAVCRQWRELASLPSLWRGLCARSLFLFLSTDPDLYSSVGSSLSSIPRTLFGPVRILGRASESNTSEVAPIAMDSTISPALADSGGQNSFHAMRNDSQSGTEVSSEKPEDDGEVVYLNQEGTAGLHHVQLFQEQLFALPFSVRCRVLPTKEMARCTSPEVLRQLLMSTAPFCDLVMASDDPSHTDDWKSIYIDRRTGASKRAIDTLYKYFAATVRTEAGLDCRFESIKEDAIVSDIAPTAVSVPPSEEVKDSQMTESESDTTITEITEGKGKEKLADPAPYGELVNQEVTDTELSEKADEASVSFPIADMAPLPETDEFVVEEEEEEEEIDPYRWREANLAGRVPPEIGLLQFETLKLPRNGLTHFPLALKALPNLRVLSLSINRLKSFPLFEFPTSVRSLRMCHNLLTSASFPEIALESINRSFDLWTPPLHTDPDQPPPDDAEVYKDYPYMMDELRFKDNQIDGCLPPALLLMSNVTLLDLAMNKITSFPRFEDLATSSSVIASSSQVSLETHPTTADEPVPEHARGLVAGGEEAADEDRELSELGLGKETRRLYRQWETNMTYLWINENSLHALPPPVMLFTNLVELDLSCNKLTTLPSAISRLQSLSWLSLDKNKLETLPPELGMLTNLGHLWLSHNSLRELPDTMSRLSSLVALALSGNKLTRMPDNMFNNARDLQELYFFRNDLLSDLSNIDASMANMTSLVKLNIHRCGLTELPNNLTVMTGLTYLELGSNKLTHLQSSLFAHITHLNSLWLYCNQIKVVPAEIGHLKFLTELHLSVNKISELPKEIGELANLTDLDLSRNLLTSLPDEMCGMTALRHLFLHQNRFKQLPPVITKLISLERLDLDGNSISRLPEGLSALTKLGLLDLNRNRISDSVALLPVCKMSNLEALFLGMNQLTELPSEIGNLTSLQSLNVIENQLRALPGSLGNMANLSYLYVCYNRLESLPSGLGSLSKLINLDVSHNCLSDISNFDMSQMTGLRVLSFYRNELSRLPPGIECLTNLSRLWVGINNVFTEAPVSLESANEGCPSPTESVDKLSQLTALKVLNLRGNNIHSIPTTFSQLTNLQVLSLWRNKLSGPNAIPTSIWVSLTNLQHLHLGENNLQCIPKEIGLLTQLLQFGFDNNGITEVPEEIGELKNLRILHLEKNALTKLPMSLSRLQRLHQLNISANQFEGVMPRVILKLTHLGCLDLSCNRFAHLMSQSDISSNIEESIESLRRLSVLNVGNNQLTELPEGLWKLPRLRCVQIKGNTALLDWAKARDRANAEPETMDKGKEVEPVEDQVESTKQSLKEDEDGYFQVMQGWVRRKKWRKGAARHKILRQQEQWWQKAKTKLYKSIRHTDDAQPLADV